ncbi:MAG: GSU2403 family nucleotidyltransferase fold protein [Pseudomonadota bacterium]
MIERHSAVAHAAYIDLLRSLLDEKASEIRGTPTRVERRGRVYWYDSYRVGSDVKKRYIGEDAEALRDRLSRHQALKADAESRKDRRSRLVRLLRAEGFLPVDGATGGLLAAMATAGVFRLGGTVVGTHAFRLYEGELGVRIAFDQSAVTNDVDIASFERLSLALGDVAEPTVGEVLDDFAFDPAPSLGDVKSWRWRQTRNDVLVEFLTPSFSEEEGVRPLAALGVGAQSLHYLNYLIAEPIQAAALYRSGVLVQVPRPERFAVHKLIVADRRREGRDSLKARKDRLQAEFLIDVLAEDRPDDLREAYEDAMGRGARWVERLERSLKSSPDAAERLAAL